MTCRIPWPIGSTTPPSHVNAAGNGGDFAGHLAALLQIRAAQPHSTVVLPLCVSPRLSSQLTVMLSPRLPPLKLNSI